MLSIHRLTGIQFVIFCPVLSHSPNSLWTWASFDRVSQNDDGRSATSAQNGNAMECALSLVTSAAKCFSHCLLERSPSPTPLLVSHSLSVGILPAQGELKIISLQDFRFSRLWLRRACRLWDVAPCGSCKNRRFGRTCRHHLQGRRNNAS
jgi:hypothetical protein